MKIKLMCLLIVATITATSARADVVIKNAYDMMNYCKYTQLETIDTIEKALRAVTLFDFKRGFCFGVFEIIYNFSSKLAPICIPQEATLGQVIRVFNAYTARHPETQHHSYKYVALLALKEAFPCDNADVKDHH